MALESWEWFVQLISCGTFTRAAEKLQMPQQTLSARLAALEKDLGAKLVVRSTPLSLTRAGQAFMDFAKSHEDSRSHMLRQVSEVTIGSFGTLKVGISNMRGRVMMPHVIKQFHKSLPGVRVKLIEGTNEELVRLAEQGEADLVVANFDDAGKSIDVRPLYEEEVVLAIDPALLEKVTGLGAAKAVELLEDSGIAPLGACPFLFETIDDISGNVARKELERAGIQTDGFVESENLMTLLALCAAGIGAVFCPTNMLDATRSLTGDLARVRLSDKARYSIGVGELKTAEPWAPAETFEDILGALYGEDKSPRKA